ncbi:hypothetical protein K3181_00505 [Qipengyuania sp. YG27]|uniref:Uncharacterized protein n=1 Tax=Qipengyuania mesophila TaxID=2867246 RepID=A0ABS7JQK9_9SPHN|nr:hypothetical protein [Qipengyuania mesophila]MBX7499919.1 hypothetical protein [Qipengyuania mesophila]
MRYKRGILMEQIGIYNAREVGGLAELLATIDCELGENEHFLIVVNNQEIAEDEGLETAMMSALAKGAKIIVVWPLEGPHLALPDILRKIRIALIKFDSEALHDVICNKNGRNDGPGGGRLPAPKTDRHCC